MGRSPCCEKEGLKKGPWTPEEDQKLLAYIEQHGHGCWRSLPAKAGLQRCGKSCRLRWTNYLRPDIKRGKFSLQEEQTIIQLHALLGNRWSAIATHLPKRTDNEIKNYWNTHLKKRLAKMGIDPVTHKPRSDALAARAAMQPMQAYEEACKEQQQQQQWGDHVVHAADAAFTGAGFTGLLLDGALNQQDLRPAASRDGADADAGLQETEEEKNYWDSILNLVNSSSSVSLPTSVVVPATEAYSSSASLQMSVLVATPEAYSSSASLTRSVEVHAPEAYSPSPAPEF